MARSGRSEPKKTTKIAPVNNDEALTERMKMYTTSSVPVRTVIFMEIGNLPPQEARNAFAAAQDAHSMAMHPTYVIPTRNGKITGDIIFENEILDVVRAICEVKDNEIVLRGGANDVNVLRTTL